MNSLLLVFVGGGLGSALRFAVGRLAQSWLPLGFPWGTLLVNLVGSLAIGALWGWWAERSIGPGAGTQLFLIPGLLGGFTTFSAFSLDAVLLWQKGETVTAAVYVLASVMLAIAGAAVGLVAVRLLS